MFSRFARRHRATVVPFPESPGQSAYRAEFCVRSIDESRYSAAQETYGIRLRTWISPRDLLSSTPAFAIHVASVIPPDEASWSLFQMGGSRLRASRGCHVAQLPVGISSVFYAESTEATIERGRYALLRDVLGRRVRSTVTIRHDGDPQVRDLGYALAVRLAKREHVAIATEGTIHGCDYLAQRLS